MDELFMEVTVKPRLSERDTWAGTERSEEETLIRLEGSAEALASLRDAITTALAAEA